MDKKYNLPSLIHLVIKRDSKLNPACRMSLSIRSLLKMYLSVTYTCLNPTS